MCINLRVNSKKKIPISRFSNPMDAAFEQYRKCPRADISIANDRCLYRSATVGRVSRSDATGSCFFCLFVGLFFRREITGLTVGGLEVAVDERDGSAVVQVVHAARDLDGPVDEDARPDLPAGQHAVQRTSAGVLHHQAQVRLLRPNQVDHPSLQHG